MTLKEFISVHAGDDTTKLLLGKAKWPEIDMDKAVTVIECRKKIRTKLPGWYEKIDIEYPDKLCTEQCSSEETAAYKAALAKRIINYGRNDSPDSEAQRTQEGSRPEIEKIKTNQSDGSATDAHNGRIADLTGGLGVDSAAFSDIANEVMYNEMEPSRANAAGHNFKILGIDNIRISCQKAVPENSGLWDELKVFSPDLIFIDPARRSASGSKVFLLEECSPDVLTLLSQIFACTANLLLKLSPMADISMAVDRLTKHGAVIREVHCIAADGECKELLIWAQKNHTGKAADQYPNIKPCRPDDWLLTVYENGQSLTLPHYTETNAKPILAGSIDNLGGMKYLFEPGKALAKAGLFNTICQYGFTKAGIHTHLYLAGETPGGNSAETNEESGVETHEGKDLKAAENKSITRLGKLFSIEDILPLNKQNIKRIGKEYPHCEVSARNIPMTSDEFRKKLGVKSGGEIHIFGVRIDLGKNQSTKKLPGPLKNQGAYLIIAKRLG